MAWRYTKRDTGFAGTSATSSLLTAGPFLVADFDEVTFSWVTDTTAASRLTVQGSNDDGLRASITDWSTMTTILSQGLFQLDTGFRWLRVLRPSSESMAALEIQSATR